MKTQLIFTAVILLSALTSALCAETNRIISADLGQIKGSRSMAWQDCAGAGRVAEGLRAGWRQQLEEGRREPGFKYLRMHGLLQDATVAEFEKISNGKPISETFITVKADGQFKISQPLRENDVIFSPLSKSHKKSPLTI